MWQHFWMNECICISPYRSISTREERNTTLILLKLKKKQAIRLYDVGCAIVDCCTSYGCGDNGRSQLTSPSYVVKFPRHVSNSAAGLCVPFLYPGYTGLLTNPFVSSHLSPVNGTATDRDSIICSSKIILPWFFSSACFSVINWFTSIGFYISVSVF